MHASSPPPPSIIYIYLYFTVSLKWLYHSDHENSQKYFTQNIYFYIINKYDTNFASKTFQLENERMLKMSECKKAN